MVYIREFDSFVAQAKTLYEQNPSKVRYSMKYRHCDGMIVLKITDDKKKILLQNAVDTEKLTPTELAFFQAYEPDVRIPSDQ